MTLRHTRSLLPRVGACIQAVPWRRDLAEGVAEQAREGGCDPVTVLYQNEGCHPWDHYFNTYRMMLQQEQCELVIRLEDDCAISPHLAHNCRSWDVIARPRFGCGLLYSPITSILDYIYHSRPEEQLVRRFFPGSVAQLFRRRDLDEHIVGMEALREEINRNWGCAYDMLLSAHCYDHGWELYTHNPPIVEHLEDPESAMGNSKDGHRTTAGAYDPKFIR